MTLSRSNHLLVNIMPQTNHLIIAEITNFIASWGGTYSEWYAGIAAIPRQRLFNGHNVNEQTDGWIYREAYDSNSARAVENYLVNTLGMAGDTGGGDSATKFIYAYRKTNQTVE